MIADGRLARLAGAMALLAVAVGLAGCAAGRSPAGPTTVTSTTQAHGAQAHGAQAPATPPRTWIFAGRALAQVTTDPAVRQLLSQGRVFEILQPGQRPLAGLEVVPTAKFASYRAMAAALTDGSIDPWVKAVLYDNEAWSATPTDEQQAPGSFMAQAAALARRHHLTFLASPALDLTTVLQPGGTARDQAYLRMGLARQAGRVADVVDVQAQSTERDPRTYASLVGQAAGQARQANPAVVVVAGLSTNPAGPPVSSEDLLAAVHATQSAVQGYWVNIPSPGPSCPGCANPRPDLAVGLLRTVAAGTPG